MDQGTRQDRLKNPRENASILSIITFYFTYRLFKKGYKRDLDDNDVYQILPSLSSKKLGNTLENRWRKYEKKNPNHSLLPVLVSCFGKKYIILGIIQLIVKTAITFIQPAALGKLVAYFQPGQTSITQNDLYQYAGVVIGIEILSTIYNHNYQQFIFEVGIRVRTAIAALIYRKALRLGPTSFSSVTMGKIVTLITKDVFSFELALIFLNDMWIGMVQTVIISYIIFARIGASVFAGVAFFLILIPLQLYVARKSSIMRFNSAKKTDERIQLTTEALSAIKILKMYTWETFFGEKIDEVRRIELKKLASVYYLKCVVLIIGSLASNISFFLLIMTYIWTGNFADAEIVYFIQSCFANLKSYITVSIPFGLAQCSEVIAALNRLRDFLSIEEVTSRQQPITMKNPKIYLKNVSVKIKGSEVLKDVSLSAEKGLYLISGNVGSGKSTLLRTILGDYSIDEGKMVVEGSISYASQEPWLFPSTIKQNILFGQEYDENRYNEVLNVCALKVDLNQFENGDKTIVGDRGINLSKGQQARINLARAVYKNSDLYLLDDCLSALDSHVNMYVFKKCILEFLSDKIVIVVTHNINHIKMVYGHNTLFIENGRTLSLEEQKQTLDKRITYYIDDVDYDYFSEEKETSKIEEIHEDEDENTVLLKDNEKEAGSNLYHEDKQSGKVTLGVYLRYYKYAGGLFVFLLVLLVFVLAQGATVLSEKLVSKWVNIEPHITDFVKKNATNTTTYNETVGSRNRILNFYCIAVLAAIVLVFTRVYFTFFFSLRASNNLHKSITYSVLNSFMTFFDGHYIGNIINRFSKDMNTTDETIPLLIYDTLRSVLQFCGILYLIASVNVLLLIPAGVLILKIYFVRRFYLPTGRSIKRLDSATRSPMIGYLNATLEGLTTVRAYEKQSLLEDEFDRHQDLYTSAYYMMTCSSRAFGFSLDMVSATFMAAIVLKFVLFDTDAQAGDVGLAISQAMLLTGLLQWAVRQSAELENNMTAIERILEYTDIETENRGIGEIKQNWPSEGRIEYKNVCLTYSTTKQHVLQNVSFIVEPKAKIGIVGRTGAGKSSIISTLFRLYEIQGKILIDNVDTKLLSLEFYRSQIAIIPQDPTLFSGTIRTNIDPTERYSDEAIWKSIEKVNLTHLFSNLHEKITEKGSNYSSGQRQLICLARALVSKNKIIVLDEATASMDPETCSLLQNTIRKNFADCTVLTIAHRLNTVLDSDKIMVVDAGKIIEYDTPKALLDNKNGAFYEMVKRSGLPII